MGDVRSALVRKNGLHKISNCFSYHHQPLSSSLLHAHAGKNTRSKRRYPSTCMKKVRPLQFHKMRSISKKVRLDCTFEFLKCSFQWPKKKLQKAPFALREPAIYVDFEIQTASNVWVTLREEVYCIGIFFCPSIRPTQTLVSSQTRPKEVFYVCPTNRSPSGMRASKIWTGDMGRLVQ